MRIAIVNDVRLALETLRRAVALVPEATIAWTAENGREAIDRCVADPPDLILMDMIMPIVDGVEATQEIMKRAPVPILVVTATVTGNASKVFDALGAGALDAVATPRLASDGTVLEAEPLMRKIRTVALLARARSIAAPVAESSTTAGLVSGTAAERSRHASALASSPAPRTPASAAQRPSMVAIGASTGGPQALGVVLKALPRPLPWPLVIVQHVDPAFAPGLAQWLAIESGHRVLPIQEGLQLTDGAAIGAALLAVSGDHLVLSGGGTLRYSVEPSELVYRPSVDVFFDSLSGASGEAAAGEAPPTGVAVVLTGMGRDGASALLRLRKRGWHTIAQDRASSVVWGMPRAAAEQGAAVEVLPIAAIGSAIVTAMARIRQPRNVR